MSTLYAVGPDSKKRELELQLVPLPLHEGEMLSWRDYIHFENSHDLGFALPLRCEYRDGILTLNMCPMVARIQLQANIECQTFETLYELQRILTDYVGGTVISRPSASERLMRALSECLESIRKLADALCTRFLAKE